MFVSASHELSQEYREFEPARRSPPMRSSVQGAALHGEIDAHIRSDGFKGAFSSSSPRRLTRTSRRIAMRADAGVGPAAGVIGTQALCHTLALQTPSRSTWRHHGQAG